MFWIDFLNANQALNSISIKVKCVPLLNNPHCSADQNIGILQVSISFILTHTDGTVMNRAPLKATFIPPSLRFGPNTTRWLNTKRGLKQMCGMLRLSYIKEYTQHITSLIAGQQSRRFPFLNDKSLYYYIIVTAPRFVIFRLCTCFAESSDLKTCYLACIQQDHPWCCNTWG